jgi:predicted nucleic acid-binding protein
MPALIDTGFLYALLDRSDRQHLAVAAVLPGAQAPLYLPTPVITEVAYLLLRNVGPTAMADFIESLASTKLILLNPESADYRRAAAIIRQYQDGNLDFVDALLVAVAERLNITQVLTVDRRHFLMVRPAHCPAFDILP